MALIDFKRGQTGVVLRVKVLNSSVSTGAGLTGLTNASSGLKISTIADNEATATAYTVAGSNVETISTLGTYAAPTSGKARFKEVDATNHPGVYEIQIADARYAVSGAKSLLVSISGATNAAETDVVIPLRDLDPYDSVRAGLTALPNAAAAASGGLPTVGTGSGQINPSSGKVPATLATSDVSGTAFAVTVAAGGITTSSFAAGAINAAAIATDAIDADALAADAVTEIWSKALTELTSIPGVTATVLQALNLVFTSVRNKSDSTDDTLTLYRDDGTTPLGTATISDDDTTFVRGELA